MEVALQRRKSSADEASTKVDELAEAGQGATPGMDSVADVRVSKKLLTPLIDDFL